MSVTIIDYGMGNIYSVNSALKSLGCDVQITNDKEIIERSDSLILPGVGAFRDAMNELIELDLIEVIKKKANDGTPLLGICLGMQLLLNSSEEFGFYEGLDLISGHVRKFPDLSTEEVVCRIPQISWNTIKINRPRLSEPDIFRLLDTEDEYMYFVHSYFADKVPEDNIYSTTEYHGFNYCSAVRSKNVFGVQFHPEKSGQKGLEILREFITLTK